MADYDYTHGSGVSGAAAVAQGLNAKGFFKDFDFRDQAVVANDTIQLEGLPDNCVAIGYSVQVLRAEGAAATLDVGITGAPQEIAAALNCNVLDTYVSVIPTTNPIGTNVNIVLTAPVGQSLSNAKVRVQWALQEFPVGKDLAI